MEWGKIQEPTYTKECNKFIKTTEFCHLQYLQGLFKEPSVLEYIEYKFDLSPTPT